MNKKLIALALFAVIAEQGAIYADVVYANNGRDCCPAALPYSCPGRSCKRRACCPRRTYNAWGSRRWSTRYNNGCCNRRTRWSRPRCARVCRPKRLCCPRYRCCRPRPSCCPPVRPVCEAYPCVTGDCPVNGTVVSTAADVVETGPVVEQGPIVGDIDEAQVATSGPAPADVDIEA